MQNIKLVIAYDGTRFLGWQKTRMGLSIEGELQKTIEQIVQHPIFLQAASRTDAGVHANGQVVNFQTLKTNFSLEKLQSSLNSLLPKDIVVCHAENVPASFHPTLDCLSKEYQYHICYSYFQVPQHRFYSWHVPYPLHFEKMQLALLKFKGVHNFAAFCNVKKYANYSSYLREIQESELKIFENDQRLVLCIRGKLFLYKMVRNIVGTIIDIGKGKIDLENLDDIIKSKKRTYAGITAPAHGLFLERIFYK